MAKKVKEPVKDAKSILADLNKVLKVDGLVKLGSDKCFQQPLLSTGSLLLDELIGGYKLGRVIEFYGAPSVGKTFMSYKAIAEAQRRFPDKEAAFIDIENTFDADFAVIAGVDIRKLHLVVPDYGDVAIDVVVAMCYTQAYSVIVCDTVAALCTKRELDKLTEEKTMGEQAQLMSRGLRKITAANKETIIIFLNQTREKIGIVYGSRTTTPGGKALGFYASQRFELVKSKIMKMKIKTWDVEKETFGDVEQVVGHTIAVKIWKDKVSGKEQHVCHIPFLHDVPGLEDVYPGAKVGIDEIGEKVVMAMKSGDIVKAGGWYNVIAEDKKYRKSQLREKFAGFEISEAKGEEPEDG